MRKRKTVANSCEYCGQETIPPQKQAELEAQEKRSSEERRELERLRPFMGMRRTPPSRLASYCTCTFTDDFGNRFTRTGEPWPTVSLPPTQGHVNRVKELKRKATEEATSLKARSLERARTSTGSHSRQNQKTASVADELTKLAKLRSEGVLTVNEFETLKRQLIEGD